MRALIAVAVAVMLAVAGCSGSAAPGAPAAAQPGKVVNLSPEQVKERLQSGERITVLDVREDWEFRAGHIPGAILIPLGTLQGRLKELDSNAPVVVVCRSGNRSAQGSEILAAAGFKAVYNMSGGMNEWKGKVEK